MTMFYLRTSENNKKYLRFLDEASSFINFTLEFLYLTSPHIEKIYLKTHMQKSNKNKDLIKKIILGTSI